LPVGGDGTFFEEFVGFDVGRCVGNDLVEEFDVAVPDFCVGGLVRVDVELFFGADWGVDGEVRPFSICVEGVEEFACTEGGGFAFAFEVETKIAAKGGGL
jgi:hypothetical protein